jgi:hypothetical protein
VIDGEGDGYSLDKLRHWMARKMSLMKAVAKKPIANATISVKWFMDAPAPERASCVCSSEGSWFSFSLCNGASRLPAPWV